MITSIVPLPEFSNCNCIFGEGKGGWFNDAEVVESAPGIDVIGRTIPILPAVWNKYKMTVRNAPTGKTYVIVFLTHQKLDIYNLWKQPFVEIYPIYLREYDVPGKPPQLRTNALLFLPQINQVLHEMGVKSVVSVTHMCYKTMDNLGCEDFSHVPKYMLDRMLDDRYGTLVPCDENVVMSLYMGGTEATQHLDTVIDYGCILKGYLPQEVEFIMCQHFLRDILPLLDPSHLMDVTTLAVLSTMDHWSAYYTWIHEKDDSCPRYQNQNLN